MTFMECLLKIGIFSLAFGVGLMMLAKKYPAVSEIVGSGFIWVAFMIGVYAALDVVFDLGKWIWGLFK